MKRMGFFSGLWVSKERCSLRQLPACTFSKSTINKSTWLRAISTAMPRSSRTVNQANDTTDMIAAEMPQHWDDVDGLHTLLQMATWRPAAKEVQS